MRQTNGTRVQMTGAGGTVEREVWRVHEECVMTRLLGLVMWFCLLTTSAVAEDFLHAVQAGRVQILALNGNGSSSGAALEGVVRNNTATDIRLDTTLPSPLFLQTGSDAQNMIATQIHMGDGGYYAEATRSFIALRPGMQTPILLVAYCADFERDNPAGRDTFSIAPFPNNLADVADRISAHEAATAGMDLTVAAQVALWIARGLSPEKISGKYVFFGQ